MRTRLEKVLGLAAHLIVWVVCVAGALLVAKVQSKRTQLDGVTRVLGAIPDHRQIEASLAQVVETHPNLHLKYDENQWFEWLDLPAPLIALRPDTLWVREDEALMIWEGYIFPSVILSWSKREGLELRGSKGVTRKYEK